MAETKSNTTNGPITKYKIVFLGDQSVGKTSIINRFIYDNFTGNEQPTVGIDFISKTLQYDNKTLRLQLWDTAGQERFHSLIPSYIRDSHAAIIVFDVTNPQSFNNINKWIDDVKEERGSDVIIYVIGNKIDLEQERKITTQQADQKAKELGVQFTEVSAKAGTNIPIFFQNLSQMLSGGNDLTDFSKKGPLSKQATGDSQQQEEKSNKLKPPEETDNIKEKSNCC